MSLEENDSVVHDIVVFAVGAACALIFVAVIAAFLVSCAPLPILQNSDPKMANCGLNPVVCHAPGAVCCPENYVCGGEQTIDNPFAIGTVGKCEDMTPTPDPYMSAKRPDASAATPPLSK